MQPKRGGGHTIAGAALRNAGLVDGDVGMRDASGPSRRGAGAGRSRKGGRNGADSNGSLSVSINGSSIPSLKPLQRTPHVSAPSQSAFSSGKQASQLQLAWIGRLLRPNFPPIRSVIAQPTFFSSTPHNLPVPHAARWRIWR